GTVRTALLSAGLIPDPYYGYDNEKSLWVEGKEWWFFRTFSVTEGLRGRRTDITFEGTSFLGEAWLNGQRLGELKGMLNPRSFDVSGLLDFTGENLLAVRLEATPDAQRSDTARGLTWDSPRDQLYSIAQCMYGWDWGPHGVPIGLWQPVRLRSTGTLRLDHPCIRSHIDSPALAECTIDLDLHNLGRERTSCAVSGSIREKETGRMAAEFHGSIDVDSGSARTLRYTVKIAEPRLWWPNGMGEQNLYVLTAAVSIGGRVSDTVTTQFGVRELKLVENEQVDQFVKSMEEDVGNIYSLGKAVGSYPWTFQVNGKKMFAKGGNWIPADQLLRLDRPRYDRLLSLARDAGFNLLRVWGGGLYETDDFYELCDQYGILAWQEFLSNRSFSHIDRENFLDGAASAILRLRNHPSLTFWCGGNEFDPDDAGSKTVIDDLGALLQSLDPQREFHRASPYMGDDHYWGVWHGQEPYTRYRVVRPFRSEAGVNAFPVPEDYRKFVPPPLVWPLDTTFTQYHGEYNTRFEHLRKLERYAGEFGPPSSIDDMIRKSELYQALANSFNMEFCRANKFRNSGLLVWQYNDIWPCISWSMVDWYGTPKPSYFFQKRASRPLHISADFERYVWQAGEQFSAGLFFLNDLDSTIAGCTYEARALDLQGRELAAASGAAHTPANRSTLLGKLSFRIPSTLAGSSFFVSAELKGGDGKLISSVLYPIAVRAGKRSDYANLFAGMDHMPAVNLVEEAQAGAKMVPGVSSGVVKITNPAGQIAYFVRLRLVEESDSLSTTYSDNYFSLLPGESESVAFQVAARSPGSIPSVLHFELSGWNCPARTLEVNLAARE
ncbi:MAG TPA: glycoside hydrolase family 2 protein, partial [Bacteroidota bacterium]